MSNAQNGGVDSGRAWVVVFAAFLGAFVAFGASYSFGVFLRPMAREFHASHTAMSAIFSTTSAFSFFLGPLTGNIADRYGPRPVVAAGAALMAAGLVITARIHYFPLIFLSYGVGLGCAVACIYIPCVAAVGAWFKKRRVVALGAAISGIGCGTLIAAPLSAELIDRYGWRSAIEIFGWAGGALLVLAAALLFRPPVSEKKTSASVFPMLRTQAFALLYISLFFVGIAIYVSFVFLPVYADDLGATRVAGAVLVGYIGASSVVGRLGLNALAPRFGLPTMYLTSYAILLGSFGFWLAAHAYPALIAFSWVMGVGYGGIAAMSPAMTAAIFGVEGLGELLGILFTALGAACLVGPPAAGALVDSMHDSKLPVFVATAAAVLAMIFVVPLRKYDVEERQAAVSKSV